MEEESESSQELNRQEQDFSLAWREIRQQGMKINFRLAHEHGMSAVQFSMLGTIERAQGQATVTRLAQQMDLDPASVVRSLDLLEKRNLVIRQRATKDRRVVMISLTEQGRTLQRDIDKQVTQSLIHQFRALSTQEQTTLVHALESFLAQGREPSE